MVLSRPRVGCGGGPLKTTSFTKISKSILSATDSSISCQIVLSTYVVQSTLDIAEPDIAEKPDIAENF